MAARPERVAAGLRDFVTKTMPALYAFNCVGYLSVAGLWAARGWYIPALVAVTVAAYSAWYLAGAAGDYPYQHDAE